MAAMVTEQYGGHYGGVKRSEETGASSGPAGSSMLLPPSKRAGTPSGYDSSGTGTWPQKEIDEWRTLLEALSSTPLHNIVPGINGPMVSRLFKLGIDALCMDSNRRTALHEAVAIGIPSTALLLLDRGADISLKDNNGRTALHDAVAGGNSSIISLLLDFGADPLLQDNNGRTALHDAAAGSNCSIILLLLKRGANVSCEDNNGRTALHNAAAGGNPSVIPLLLEKGVNVSCKDKSGRTALHEAADGDQFIVIKELIRLGADVSCQDNSGYTPLHDAAARGNTSITSLLLEEGADVSRQDNNGRTALHDAAAGGNSSIIPLLLKKGTDMSCRDKSGRTVLHEAAYENKFTVVKELICLGVDLSCQDNNGWTALHDAVAGGDPSIISLLLEEGADISSKDKNRRTALHDAAARGKLPIISLLLEKGADALWKDKDGRTALHDAASRGHLEVVNKLIQLEEVDVSSQDNTGHTALHEAASEGYHFVVGLLLASGVNISCRDTSGCTALELAASSQHAGVVRLLTHKGPLSPTGGSFASSLGRRGNRPSQSRPGNHMCPFYGCGETFKYPSKLKGHEHTHRQAKTFSCNFGQCTKSFKRIRELKAHKKTHPSYIPDGESRDHDMVDIRQVGYQTAKETHSCLLVEPEDGTKEGQGVASPMALPSRPPTPSESGGHLPCELCTGSFKSIEQLKAHEKTHTYSVPEAESTIEQEDCMERMAKHKPNTDPTYLTADKPREGGIDALCNDEGCTIHHFAPEGSLNAICRLIAGDDTWCMDYNGHSITHVATPGDQVDVTCQQVACIQLDCSGIQTGDTGLQGIIPPSTNSLGPTTQTSTCSNLREGPPQSIIKTGPSGDSSCHGRLSHPGLSTDPPKPEDTRAHRETEKGKDKGRSEEDISPKHSIEHVSATNKVEEDDPKGSSQELVKQNDSISSDITPHNPTLGISPSLIEKSILRWSDEKNYKEEDDDEEEEEEEDILDEDDLEDGDGMETSSDCDSSCYSLETPPNKAGAEGIQDCGGVENVKGKGKGNEDTSRKRSAQESFGSQSKSNSQDDGESPPPKRAKRDRGSQTKPPDQSKSPFACPYFKKSPLKYPDCAEWRNTKIRFVKEHCKSHHLRPLRCGRCKSFRAGTHTQIDQHLSDENCQKPEAFNPAEKDIDIEKAGEMDKAKTWQRIYEILFPLYIPNTFWQDLIEVLMSTVDDKPSFMLRVSAAVSFSERVYQSGLAEFLQNRLELVVGASEDLLGEYNKVWRSKQSRLLNDAEDSGVEACDNSDGDPGGQWYGHGTTPDYLSTQPHEDQQPTNPQIPTENLTDPQNKQNSQEPSADNPNLQYEYIPSDTENFLGGLKDLEDILDPTAFFLGF